MTAPTAPRRGRLLATVVLLLVALAGGIAGIALDRRVLLPRMFGPRSEHGPRRPGHEFRRRFAREIGLTEEQQTRIDSIMERQGREVRGIRERIQPQLDSIISRTRRELDSVLTPEQRKKAEEGRRRHPRPLGSPPDRPPPGELGGPRPEGPPS